MKNKKKGASKKTWAVDCRTDSAFDFALTVLNESEKKKYPLELRANFVKIAYDNSCEAIAKAQTDPMEYKLKTSMKLFSRNLEKIHAAALKLYSEIDENPLNLARFPEYEKIVDNPFNYYDINFEGINKTIEHYLGSGECQVDEWRDTPDSYEVYSYPKIYEKYHVRNNLSVRLMPTNDIIVNLSSPERIIFELAEKSAKLYQNRKSVCKNVDFIKYIIANMGYEGTMTYPESVLVNVPKDSFKEITDIVEAAATRGGEFVSEISITAYRLGKNNPLINSLIKASNNGISCNLYLELNARGEVENDIKYLNELVLKAGDLKIKINYNGIKVHGKMIYIKFANDNPPIGIFSTGNYNPQTANVYKDYHYITCDRSVTQMIEHNFNVLWNSDQPVLSSISNIIVKEIYEEISKGEKGRIWIQTNHLDNKRIVSLLKEACSRGCDVKLIVRTTKGFHNREFRNCKTVVGKYLEHSRVYIFGKGNPRVYLSSSDILFRNLYNRFESYVKIPDTDRMITNTLVSDFENLYKHGQKSD